MNTTLLLIPGLLNTPRVFDRLMARLPALLGPAVEVRIATVHTQDHLPAMAETAWQSLADVPADHALVLAGFSMGGYVALQMLAEPRRAVQGLAMVCSSARADTPEGSAQREKAITAMARDFNRFTQALLVFLLGEEGAKDPDLVAALQADMAAVGPAAASQHNRALMQRPDQRALLPGLRLQAQIVAGERDPVTPPALSQEMAAAIPGAQLSLVAGAGHMLPAQYPHELAQALHSLVQRVQASAVPVAQPAGAV